MKSRNTLVQIRCVAGMFNWIKKGPGMWQLVMPKSGSVRFSGFFREPKTGPTVRFKEITEP